MNEREIFRLKPPSNIGIIEDCHLHLYGKLESKHLKKIGHITALDESSENADLKAKQALSNIKMDVRRSN